jgi:hypothetical protein
MKVTATTMCLQDLKFVTKVCFICEFPLIGRTVQNSARVLDQCLQIDVKDANMLTWLDLFVMLSAIRLQRIGLFMNTMKKSGIAIKAFSMTKLFFHEDP